MAKGYLPRELPPSFSSFALAAALESAVLGASRAESALAAHCALATHSIPRLDGTRRVLGIPNPIAFLPLAHTLCDAWRTLDAWYARSRFGAARPLVHASASRALIAGFSARAREQLGDPRTRANGLVLQADIRSCSASVEHGALERVQARPAPDDVLSAGRSLARRCGHMQRGVARGLPAGPDTTLALIEMVLTAADLELERRMPGLRGLRRCDNYELECADECDAVTTRDQLGDVLGEYGLELHPAKTSIVEGRAAHSPDWLARLDSLPLRGPGLADELPAFVERVLELIEVNAGAPVADRALSRLLALVVGPREVGLLRDARMCIAAAAPSVLRFVLRSLEAECARGLPMDEAWLERELGAIIERHAPRGDASEVAWALWATLAFGVRVDAASAAAISRMRDDVVALLALEAVSRGLIGNGLDPSAWIALANERALHGEHWLLAFEAAAHGWLGEAAGVRAVAADPGFGPLLRAGVRFLVPAPGTVAA